MVIGKGLISITFQLKYGHDSSFLIFASGVSNSKCIDENQYNRERKLLQETIIKYPDAHFVYFSTCSVYDTSLSSSRYVIHKLEMENIVSSNATTFSIFRVSNLVGQSSNPNTMINFFINHITTGQHFEVWKNTNRNLLDVEDMALLVNGILENKYKTNSIINIAHKVSYSTPEIVNLISEYCGKSGNYTVVNKGSSYQIDLSEINEFIMKLPSEALEKNYLSFLLNKYYAVFKV